MNTLKFGNGEWYGKKDTILAYNDENSNYKPLPFDFSRASSATVINKEGLIETVGSGQPRVDYKDDSKGAMLLEPSRTNLITYSSDFPRNYWTKSGATIQGDPSTAGSEVITNGGFDTDSYWNKLGNTTISGGKLNIINSNGGVINQANVWEVGKTYKIVVQCTFVSGNRIILPYDGSNFGKKVTTPSSETYTYYYTPTSSTNLVIYSDGNGNGSIDNLSVKEVQGFTSPDGTTNAYKLVEDTNNSIHRMYQTATVSASPNASISIYVKYNGRKFVLMRIADSIVGRWYDIENGVLGGTFQGTPNDSSIESVGNGWYRISISNTVSSVARLELWVSDTESTSAYQGNGTSGVYIYGSQLEVGNYSTSLINTQGSAVTRLADSCSQTVPDGVIGQTEGTLFAEIDFKSKPEAGSPIVGIITLNNNVANLQNVIILGIERQSGGVNRFYPFVQVGNSTVAYIIGQTLTDGVYKVAFAYKQNDFILYVNGVQIGTDNSGAVPTTSQVLVAERFNGDTFKFADGIKNTKVYNTRLSNSELAALTQV